MSMMTRNKTKAIFSTSVQMLKRMITETRNNSESMFADFESWIQVGKVEG